MSDDPLRGTGRTTRLTAHYLKACLDHPGEWVDIRDHYDRGCAHRWLAVTVGSFLDLMHVEHRTDGSGKIMVLPIERKR